MRRNLQAAAVLRGRSTAPAYPSDPVVLPYTLIAPSVPEAMRSGGWEFVFSPISLPSSGRVWLVSFLGAGGVYLDADGSSTDVIVDSEAGEEVRVAIPGDQATVIAGGPYTVHVSGEIGGIEVVGVDVVVDTPWEWPAVNVTLGAQSSTLLEPFDGSLSGFGDWAGP